jgi:hypothetical protein
MACCVPDQHRLLLLFLIFGPRATVLGLSFSVKIKKVKTSEINAIHGFLPLVLVSGMVHPILNNMRNIVHNSRGLNGQSVVVRNWQLRHAAACAQE